MRPVICFAILAAASWINWGFNVDEVSEFWAGMWWITNVGLTLYAAVWFYSAIEDRPR